MLLGGECSNLLGPALALKRRGRYGVVYLDGHSDFRTVDNTPYVGAAGGEALALVTGRGQADLTDLEDLGPYTRDTDAAMLGDPGGRGVRRRRGGAGIPVWPALKVAEDPAAAASGVLAHLERDELDGFWVHLDVDILDAKVMPAVDSPDPAGSITRSSASCCGHCSPHRSAWASTSASSTPTSTRTAATPPSSPTPWWRPSDLKLRLIPDRAWPWGSARPRIRRTPLGQSCKLHQELVRAASGVRRSGSRPRCANGDDSSARAPSSASRASAAARSSGSGTAT